MLYEGCTSSSQSFISCLQKKYKAQEPVQAQIDDTARGRHAIHYALVGAFPNAAQKIHYALVQAFPKHILLLPKYFMKGI